MAAKGSRSPSSPGHGAAHRYLLALGERPPSRQTEPPASCHPGQPRDEQWRGCLGREPGAPPGAFWVPQPLPGHAGARGQWGCQARELRPTAHCWAACTLPKDLCTLPLYQTASVMLGRGSGTGCPRSAAPCTHVPCATPGDGQGWGTGHTPPPSPPQQCDANMSLPCRRKTQISSPTSQGRSWASPTGRRQLVPPPSAPYHSSRVGRNCPSTAPLLGRRHHRRWLAHDKGWDFRRLLSAFPGGELPGTGTALLIAYLLGLCPEQGTTWGLSGAEHAHPEGQHLPLLPGASVAAEQDPRRPRDAAGAGAGVHTSSRAGFVLQGLLGKLGVLPAPLSLLQWDGAVQIPMACPRGSTDSRSGRMGATVKRQLLSWPRNTLIPEDPRAQAHCSSRGRA